MGFRKTLPDTIELAGHTITIINRKLSNAYGECDEIKREILIDLDLHKKDGVDPVSTLYHELIHMTFHICGLDNVLDKADDGLEEAIVKCLENLLFPALNQLIR